MIKNEWYPFDEKENTNQNLPPKKKLVLVLLKSNDKNSPDAIVLGWTDISKIAKTIIFVTPGAARLGNASAWCDCLDNGFKYGRF